MNLLVYGFIQAFWIAETMSASKKPNKPMASLSAQDFLSRRRTRLLGENIKSALIVSVINAFIIWLLISQNTPTPLIHYWFGVAVLASLYRGYLLLSLPGDAISFPPFRWIAFVATTALAGAMWPMPLFMLPSDIDPAYAHLIIFVVAGMTAAAAHSYATHPQLVVAFVMPALAVLIYYYVENYRDTSYFIAAFAVLYFLGTYSVTRRASRSLIQAIRNQWQSERRRKDLEEKREQLRVEFAAKKKSEARQKAQVEKIRAFNSTLDQLFQKHALQQSALDEFYEDCIKTVSDALSIERVSIWSFSENREAILCEVLFQATKGTVEKKGATLSARMYPAYFSCLRENRVIVASDAETDPQTIEFLEVYLEPNGIKSLLDAPIRSHDGVAGIICCESVGAHREWKADEIGFLASVAQLVSTRLFSEEAKTLNEELTIALNTAQNANKAKEEFMATMNHELRTPMNGVLGAASLLQQSELDTKNRKLARAISQSGDVLMRLLNDMLDFSKLEAGKVTLENVGFHINALVEDALTPHAYTASEKKLKLERQIDTPKGLTLFGDPVRVAQIIHNLISNAVKFTEKGSVRVCVSYAEESGLEITVEDTGIGIAENRIMEIFQPFFQAESSTTRRFGGTGLGLTIVDRLVYAFDGTLSVQSKIGVGTTLNVHLPLEVCEPVQSGTNDETETGAASRINTQGARVLLVDDNQTNLLVISAFLKKGGAVVTTADGGISAIKAFEEGDFDAVLMDIHMPGMDGVEAMQRIRRDYPHKAEHVPVIAVTADAMPEQVANYRRAGFDDHIAKPVNEGKLIACLEMHLRQFGNATKAAASA